MNEVHHISIISIKSGVTLKNASSEQKLKRKKEKEKKKKKKKKKKSCNNDYDVWLS